MSGCDISINLPLELKKYAQQNRIPLTATFELTPFCNFSCVMCYVRLSEEQAKKQGEMLSAEQWINIAQQAHAMGTMYISLTGGEPMSRPDFWEIYSKLNEMGFLISILSNGSLIDEKAMDNFRKFGMPYLVKLSLYGASDETYNKICGTKNGFTKVSKAVRLLKEAEVALVMTGTIVRENAADLQQMYEISRKWNVPFQHTVTVVKSARGAVNSADASRFPFEEFIDELDIEQLEKNKFPMLESPFAWCSSYGSSFWMTWNGHLQLCSFMNGPYATLDNGLEDAWTELGKKLDELKNPKECKNCEYSVFCQRCPGVLCGESGDPEKTTTEFCKTAERLYYAYKKLKKE